MRLIVFVFVVLLSLTGCVAEAVKPVSESEDGPTKITLTPVNLFKGDEAKYQPFLGTMSGAIKIRYERTKPNAILDMDIWQNGKKVASSGSIGDLFFSPADRKSHEVEVIVSIDSVSIDDQDEFNKIKVSTGSSLATFTVPWDKKLTTRGMIYNNESRTFIADESKSIYLLGMQATSTNQMITADFTPESLNRLEWALIFTLRFEKL